MVLNPDAFTQLKHTYTSVGARCNLLKMLLQLMYAGLCYFVSCCFFIYVFQSLWSMFDAAILEARSDSSRNSLYVLRAFTVVSRKFHPWHAQASKNEIQWTFVE